jgi:hypothetical protein
MQGMAAASQSQQQKNVAQYNATALNQEAKNASDTGAMNEGQVLRRGEAALGEQAAAFSGNNIGTGGSVATVERQSARDVRMNALNTWYSGELERSSLKNQANFQQWQADQQKPLQAGLFAGIGSAVGSGAQLGTSMLMKRKNYGSSGASSANLPNPFDPNDPNQ